VKRFVIVVLLLALAVPAFAGTHQDVFNVLAGRWPAVSDTLKNSGKYWVKYRQRRDERFVQRRRRSAKRTISVVLMPRETVANCRRRRRRAAGHHDAADFKDRVTLSLAKLQNARPVRRQPAQGARKNRLPEPR